MEPTNQRLTPMTSHGSGPSTAWLLLERGPPGFEGRVLKATIPCATACLQTQNDSNAPASTVLCQ